MQRAAPSASAKRNPLIAGIFKSWLTSGLSLLPSWRCLLQSRDGSHSASVYPVTGFSFRLYIRHSYCGERSLGYTEVGNLLFYFQYFKVYAFKHLFLSAIASYIEINFLRSQYFYWDIVQKIIK